MEKQVKDEVRQFSEHFISSFNRFLKEEVKRHFYSAPSSLYRAIEYSLTSDGKRIRPLLFFASSSSFGSFYEELFYFAFGVEMIHTYTLIHDDLPSIDDDVERRGKPTTHVVFGEAVALLAGDTLLSEGTRYLFHKRLREKIPPDVLFQMMDLILSSSGINGITSGQVLDKEYEGKSVGEKKIKNLYNLKTGNFLGAVIACGYLASGKKDEKKMYELFKVGSDFGIAYQIANDIYDFVKKGKDREKGKATLVDLLGKEKARLMYEEIMNGIYKRSAKLTEPGSPLIMAFQYIDDLIQAKWVS